MYKFKGRSAVLTLLAIALAAVVSFTTVGVNVYALALSGVGTVNSSDSSALYGSLAQYGYAETTDSLSRAQRIHTVTFDPAADVEPQVVYGKYVYGKNTLSKLTQFAESSEGGGRTVIAAINGDYFDTYDGIAFGMTIVDGKLINNATEITAESAIDGKTDTRIEQAFGFKKDGTAVWGTPNIAVEFSVNGGSKTAIDQVNRRRKGDNWWGDIRLLTEEFGAVTESQDAAGGTGRDVVLKINSADADKGLKIGAAVRATVESVSNTPAGSNAATPIGKGKMVLTSVSGSKLEALTVGASVEITVTDKDNKWNDVHQAMGAYRILAENGSKIAPYGTGSATHPRSAIGIKADGTCVFLEADGRQTEAHGLSYAMVLDYLMNEHGCVTVIELDGGGSSQIMTRRDSDNKAVTKNVPSDPGQNAAGAHGTERGLALAWVIVPRVAETVYHTVTFKAGMTTVGTYPVEDGGSFNQTYPAVPPKAGYTGVWNPEDLAKLNNVTQNITVTAVYTEGTGGTGCNSFGGQNLGAGMFILIPLTALGVIFIKRKRTA